MGWLLKQSVAPTTEPVTLAEAKQQLRIVDDASHDDLITRLIQMAREHVEAATNRQLVTATYKLYLDGFREALAIQLPRPPLGTVSSIQYRDTADATQTWAASNYVVVADSPRRYGHIRVAPLSTYPSTYSDRYDAVTITYTAGYGAASAVPAGLKQAILAIVATSFTYDSDVVTGTIKTEVPQVAERHYGRYVVMGMENPWLHQYERAAYGIV